MTQQVDFEKACQAARRVLELDKAATPLPWKQGISICEDYLIIYDGDDWQVANFRNRVRTKRQCKDNAIFAAETRTLAPMLARAVLELLEQKG
jgi:hypothetical protein